MKLQFNKLRLALLISLGLISVQVLADDLIKVLRFSDKTIYIKENDEIKLSATSMFENQQFFVVEGPDASNFYKIENETKDQSHWVAGSGIITNIEKVSIDCKSTKNQFAYDSNLYGPRGAGKTC
jgi:hypothetical protein